MISICCVGHSHPGGHGRSNWRVLFVPVVSPPTTVRPGEAARVQQRSNRPRHREGDGGLGDTDGRIAMVALATVEADAGDTALFCIDGAEPGVGRIHMTEPIRRIIPCILHLWTARDLWKWKAKGGADPRGHSWTLGGIQGDDPSLCETRNPVVPARTRVDPPGCQG